MTIADEIIAIEQQATRDQFGAWLASNAHRIIEALREGDSIIDHLYEGER